MCWSALNSCFSSNKKPKDPSSEEKRKKRGSPADDVLHGRGKPVVAEVSEKRRSKETHRKRSSAETETPRSPRREREGRRSRSQYDDVHRHREPYTPTLDERPSGSMGSSQETLLNPRPHRSQHNRQRHPKQTSQSTLRGRGAKRDPPRHSKSKKNLKSEPSGWSLFSPSPPKTPSRRNYQTLDSSPRSHRSSRQHRSPQSQESPVSSRSQHRGHRSRQHDRESSSSRRTRSRTPNAAAPRVPDRRFAVLAATNQALENVRREAFSQASPPPPPRRERLRRYEGVTLPTSQIPFNWDCMSSSQASAGNGEATPRPRRSRR
ncbi:hypothetical protein P153DRAFT_374111 [Dothidotthia symphoricarpi CBS 119687]|uniref:Uncharacterized protein n=1 Tax=Dothidotthia symphoricarpi CBS 119687 TaxID=1392245 RepID=A0A6A6AN51_9PLEO|nr:uncharacterized protein P153DRAFT_374111 [Dothidotthia symphoricarpi CBS 119687]KAF2132364.1 hypothetical protein P153DRAFT_374111 [Dothidotthia symphoricarpi CBS 119687]